MFEYIFIYMLTQYSISFTLISTINSYKMSQQPGEVVVENIEVDNKIQQGQAIQEPVNIQQSQPLAENIIPQLRQQPNFLAVRYNQQKKQQKSKMPGGVYVPPHKLRAMQQKILEEDANSVDHQRMMWELLRKSINGIVNKVNISNIQNIVIELFNENILRGKGLLTKALIKAQMASPNFTHVYVALISVINSKLPEIGNLLTTRVMIMFNRSFHRNNKIVCMATTKMIAHLVNQRVLGQFVALQLLMILLMHATQDSVEIACDFMTEVGQVLGQLSPAASSAIFQRFKNLLHEGEIGQKAQYSIQKLFAIRKTGFKNHPGVIPQLDLVEAEDQITHNLDFEDQLKGQQNLNFFREDPNYQKTQEEWDSIKLQILGEQNIINLKQVVEYEEQVQEYNPQQQEGIKDLTQQDLINLRRTIYLAIQSTVNFQECAHKIIKMNITKGYESQLIDMIIECCMMERIYQQFFGLLSERFCKIDDKYKELFIQAFVNYYNTIFKLEVNKIRNLGKLYAHLFYTLSIDWKIMEIITLKQDTTTSAHRMFLKILFRQIVENLGLEKLMNQFNNPLSKENYSGLFPIGHPNDVRFAINYWTSIGLGPLTQQLRQVLKFQQEMLENRRNREQQERIQQLLREQRQMLMAEQQQRVKQQQRKRIIQEEEKIKRQEQMRRERQEKQRARQLQRRERQKQRLRERDRQRSRQKYREKQRQRQRRDKQRSVEKKNKRRSKSSSSSSQSQSQSNSGSDSSSSSSSTKKVNKLPPSSNQNQAKKNKSPAKPKDSSSDSESSGISSQQSVKKKGKNEGEKSKKNERKEDSSSSQSDSSDSSQSSSSSQSRRSANKNTRKKRKSSSQSNSQSDSNKRRNGRRSYESPRKRRN